MQMGKDFILREYTSRESQISDLDVRESLCFVVRTTADDVTVTHVTVGYF